MEVVVGNKNVEEVADEDDDFALDDLHAFVHVQHFALVLSFDEDGGDLQKGLKCSKDVLQSIHLHASWLVDHCLFFADNFEFSQKHAVVEDIEENSEEMLKNGENFQSFGLRSGIILDEDGNFFADLCGMFECA
jgi:hypothetical protein